MRNYGLQAEKASFGGISDNKANEERKLSLENGNVQVLGLGLSRWSLMAGRLIWSLSGMRLLSMSL